VSVFIDINFMHDAKSELAVASTTGSSCPKNLKHHVNKTEEYDMNWDRVEGNWKQFSGKVKEKWGKLTDDDLATINGRREQLEGKIQERYGYGKDQVKKELDDWSNSL
jgi:uncharacterized protein YjbJ (UPF0337 family)